MASSRSISIFLTLALVGLMAFAVGCGSDDPAGPNEQIDTAPPAVPSGVHSKVILAGQTEIEVTWDANVTDADLAGYMVYRSRNATTGYEPVGTQLISTNTWTDHSVEPGSTYFYRVSSRDASANESAMSAAASSTASEWDGPKQVSSE